jgi:hypothetical protein
MIFAKGWCGFKSCVFLFVGVAYTCFGKMSGTMQNKVDYITEDGFRKSITPREVQRIEFEYGEQYHVLISTYFNANYYLMPAEVDDKLRVLRYFPTMAAGGETIFETDEVNIRVLSIEGDNQGYNTKIFRLGFRRSMLDLFSRYPDMQQKIKNRTYTYDNWEEMVKYFNEHYGANAEQD